MHNCTIAWPHLAGMQLPTDSLRPVFIRACSGSQLPTLQGGYRWLLPLHGGNYSLQRAQELVQAWPDDWPLHTEAAGEQAEKVAGQEQERSEPSKAHDDEQVGRLWVACVLPARATSKSCHYVSTVTLCNKLSCSFSTAPSALHSPGPKPCRASLTPLLPAWAYLRAAAPPPGARPWMAAAQLALAMQAAAPSCEALDGEELCSEPASMFWFTSVHDPPCVRSAQVHGMSSELQRYSNN